MTDQSAREDEVLAGIVAAAKTQGFSLMSQDELATFMAQASAASAAREEADRAEGKTFLDEERDRVTIDGWYAAARKVATPEALSGFVVSLTNDYHHDYGTICHALAAAAVAAASCVNRSPVGGITGFQAGAVMWQFIEEWMQEPGPKRLVKYADLLYPQYVADLAKPSISADTRDWLRDEAQKKLASTQREHVHADVWEHWQRLALGVLPEPFVVRS